LRETRSRYLPPGGLALALAIPLLTAVAALAQHVDLHVAPPDPAAEGAARAAAAAAPHLAEVFGVAPLAELGPAAVEAPERLAALAAWNAARRLPAQNGFARLLPAPRRVHLDIGPPIVGGEPAASTARTSSATPAGSQPPAVSAAPPATPAAAGSGPPLPVVERDGGILAQTSLATVAWGGKVRVAGAVRLRLHLAEVSLPAGARLWVHGGGGQMAGPFGPELLAPDGGLWTPNVEGDEVSLDVEAPAAALAAGGGYGFTIDAALELVDLGAGAKAGGCMVDASCVGSGDFPGYNAARHAVGLMEFVEDFVGFTCTGQLLNDTAGDGAPFLLTAHHCISTQAVASSLQVLFDDFTPSCNGTPPAHSSLPTASGSTLLVTGRADTAPDFTLLRLSSVPSGRTFLGWDADPRATPDGTALYRISHPEGESQMFSVTIADSGAAGCTEDNLPLSRFIYSDLAVGAAAPGSSGSAVMLADGWVVGQLFGGCGFGDFCNANVHVVDGAIAASFDQLQAFIAPGTPGSCAAGGSRLCLQRQRFQVQVTWANQFDGSAGVARALAASDETGYFYFTDPAIVELVVKVLDFGDVFKVFYAELTNLRFTLTVVDTRTGRIKTYTNTAGDCGALDGTGFPAGAPGASSGEFDAAVTAAVVAAVNREWPGGYSVSAEELAKIPTIKAPSAAPFTGDSAGGDGDALSPAFTHPSAAAGRRAPKPLRGGCGAPLCLLDGRFGVSVQWLNQFTGASGDGRAQALSDASGQFSFGDPGNVELVLKVVPLPGRVAFFYAALSNLEYDITVVDSAHGQVKTYYNPAGRYCGGLDNSAFPP
jgi:hypothetical protein